MSGVFSNSSALTLELVPGRGRWQSFCGLYGLACASLLLLELPVRPFAALALLAGGLWVFRNWPVMNRPQVLHLLALVGVEPSGPAGCEDFAGSPPLDYRPLQVSQRTLVASFAVVLCTRAECGSFECWWLWRNDYAPEVWRRLQVFLRCQCR